MVEGNNVVELVNGDKIFASMLEAIHGARKTITFETFIWSSGKVGSEFVEDLAERARPGEFAGRADGRGEQRCRTRERGQDLRLDARGHSRRPENHHEFD